MRLQNLGTLWDDVYKRQNYNTVQYTHHSETQRDPSFGIHCGRGTSPLNKQEGNAAMDLPTHREQTT